MHIYKDTHIYIYVSIHLCVSTIRNALIRVIPFEAHGHVCKTMPRISRNQRADK